MGRDRQERQCQGRIGHCKRATAPRFLYWLARNATSTMLFHGSDLLISAKRSSHSTSSMKPSPPHAKRCRCTRKSLPEHKRRLVDRPNDKRGFFPENSGDDTTVSPARLMEDRAEGGDAPARGNPTNPSASADHGLPQKSDEALSGRPELRLARADERKRSYQLRPNIRRLQLVDTKPLFCERVRPVRLGLKNLKFDGSDVTRSMLQCGTWTQSPGQPGTAAERVRRTPAAHGRCAGTRWLSASWTLRRRLCSSAFPA